MDARFTAPFLILAETAASTPGSWELTLANYGVAGIVIAWFMWKDKLDRDERKQAQIDQERRHNDNLSQQKRIEDAFHSTTDSLIVGLSALKTIDSGYAELLAKMKQEHAKDQ